MISAALRSGIPINEVRIQLRWFSFDCTVGLGPNKVSSVPNAAGMALDDRIRTKQGIQHDML